MTIKGLVTVLRERGGKKKNGILPKNEEH